MSEKRARRADDAIAAIEPQPETAHDPFADKPYNSLVSFDDKARRWRWQISFIDRQPVAMGGYLSQGAARQDCQYVIRRYLAARRKGTSDKAFVVPGQLLYQ